MKITGIGIAVSSGEEPIPWPVRESAVSRRYRPAASLAEMVHHALTECAARGPIVLASCNGKVTTWDDDDWRASFDFADIVDAQAARVAAERAKLIATGELLAAGELIATGQLLATGELGAPPQLEDRPSATVLGRAVASAQCASGMHALYIARALLDAGHPEVTVLAVDIASAPAHDNFEALRVLTDEPAPYTERSAGFQLGEAAVALRLARNAFDGVGVVGPALGYDLDDEDALDRCLRAVIHGADVNAIGRLKGDYEPSPQLVVGQGAGPVHADRAELAAIDNHVPIDVPITTALASAGHTLGASSLLSVSLAAAALLKHARYAHDLARLLLAPPGSRARANDSPVDIDGKGLGASQAFDLRARELRALDGRELGLRAREQTRPDGGEVASIRATPDRDSTELETDDSYSTAELGSEARPLTRAVALVRALGGGCGAVLLGSVVEKGTPAMPERMRARAAGEAEPIIARTTASSARNWGPRTAPPPLRDETLRRIAAEVDAQRPEEPPDLVVITLECPLPPAARIGQRILPTSVLEMTPGFIPQLVARAWGFRGPALCLVGPDPEPLLAALRNAHERVFRLAIRGMHERDVDWLPRG